MNERKVILGENLRSAEIEITAENKLISRYQNTNDFTKCYGEKGDRGDQGEKGRDGPKGCKGNPGVPGEKGEIGDNGSAGPYGPKGGPGNLGPKGVNGDNGLKGNKGDIGTVGYNGTSFVLFKEFQTVDELNLPEEYPDNLGQFVSVTSNESLYQYLGPDQGTVGYEKGFKLNGTFGEVSNVKGSDGPQGENGNKGITGIQGTQGRQGERGPDGSKGFKGPQGSKGPEGDTGVPGGPGSSGQKGDAGDRGQQGNAGISGTPGSKGPTGSTGTKGQQGVKGMPAEGYWDPTDPGIWPGIYYDTHKGDSANPNSYSTVAIGDVGKGATPFGGTSGNQLYVNGNLWVNNTVATDTVTYGSPSSFVNFRYRDTGYWSIDANQRGRLFSPALDFMNYLNSYNPIGSEGQQGELGYEFILIIQQIDNPTVAPTTIKSGSWLVFWSHTSGTLQTFSLGGSGNPLNDDLSFENDPENNNSNIYVINTSDATINYTFSLQFIG